MAKNFGRREFLAAAGVVGAAAAGGALLSGCGKTAENQSSGDSAEGPAAPEYSAEEFCDVVVCGTGTSGTAAAVRAADLDAKVICLEKLDARGGTSQFTEGFAVVNSKATNDAGVTFDPQEAFMTIMKYCDWGSLSGPLRTYVAKSGEAATWAGEKGVEVTATNPIMMSDEITYVNGTTIDGEYALNDPGLNDPLWAYADSTGNVDLRLETPLTGLVVEDGRVTGCYATGPDGNTTKISCRAVILATGGFCGNKEMFENYTNYPYERFLFYGLQGRDGDGIRFANEAGAMLHAPAGLMYTWGAAAGTVEMNDVLNAAITWAVHVTVNQDGERFYNEGLAHTDPTTRNIALMGQKCAYQIVDSEYIGQMAAVGDIDYGSGVSTGDLMERLSANPDCHTADTLADLADQIGVPADALEKTVAAYNSYVDQGSDPEYGVNPVFMRKCEKAPFYAVLLQPSAFTTIGGLATDAEMRVLGADMEPIDGLFAAGTDNGSPYYRDYPMTTFGGMGQGWCLTSGYVAANAACSSL